VLGEVRGMGEREGIHKTIGGPFGNKWHIWEFNCIIRMRHASVYMEFLLLWKAF